MKTPLLDRIEDMVLQLSDKGVIACVLRLSTADEKKFRNEVRFAAPENMRGILYGPNFRNILKKYDGLTIEYGSEITEVF